MDPENTVIQRAVPHLVALATAMRSDWKADDLSGAILAAKLAGWDWERTAKEVWRLLWTEDGSPASLRAACRSPFERPAAGGWRPGAGGTGLPKSDEVRALVEAAKERFTAATPVVRKDDPPRSVA